MPKDLPEQITPTRQPGDKLTSGRLDSWPSPDGNFAEAADIIAARKSATPAPQAEHPFLRQGEKPSSPKA